MKTRILLIVATLATLIAGSATANTHEAGWSESMTVDAVEPVRATLLPVVSIDATQATSESNPATMRVADTAPIEVTLLPTVRITARMRQELATTLLPTVRVTPGLGDDRIVHDRIGRDRRSRPLRFRSARHRRQIAFDGRTAARPARTRNAPLERRSGSQPAQGRVGCGLRQVPACTNFTIMPACMSSCSSRRFRRTPAT